MCPQKQRKMFLKSKYEIFVVINLKRKFQEKCIFLYSRIVFLVTLDSYLRSSCVQNHSWVLQNKGHYAQESSFETFVYQSKVNILKNFKFISGIIAFVYILYSYSKSICATTIERIIPKNRFLAYNILKHKD